MSATHELKTWPVAFEFAWGGIKQFEIRPDDRGFREGDTLHLREWVPETREYTGRVIIADVTCVMRNEWGLPPGLAVLGIRETGRVEAPE